MEEGEIQGFEDLRERNNASTQPASSNSVAAEPPVASFVQRHRDAANFATACFGVEEEDYADSDDVLGDEDEASDADDSDKDTSWAPSKKAAMKQAAATKRVVAARGRGGVRGGRGRGRPSGKTVAALAPQEILLDDDDDVEMEEVAAPAVAPATKSTPKQRKSVLAESQPIPTSPAPVSSPVLKKVAKKSTAGRLEVGRGGGAVSRGGGTVSRGGGTVSRGGAAVSRGGRGAKAAMVSPMNQSPAVEETVSRSGGRRRAAASRVSYAELDAIGFDAMEDEENGSATPPTSTLTGPDARRKSGGVMREEADEDEDYQPDDERSPTPEEEAAPEEEEEEEEEEKA